MYHPLKPKVFYIQKLKTNNTITSLTSQAAPKTSPLIPPISFFDLKFKVYANSKIMINANTDFQLKKKHGSMQIKEMINIFIDILPIIFCPSPLLEIDLPINARKTIINLEKTITGSK